MGALRLRALLFAAAIPSGCLLLVPIDDEEQGGEGEGETEGCDQVRCPPRSRCVRSSCIDEDPCRDLVCDDGFVCSLGSCVNALLDADGDGYAAASDCDDEDPVVIPGSTAPCSSPCGDGVATCSAGRWQQCSAPTDCGCEPGETRAEPCGRCGTSTRLCGDDGVWDPQDGACEQEGVCESGANEVRPCPEGGACMQQERTCTATCVWGDWGPCDGQSECEPGATDSAECAGCGERTRTCSDQCLWSAYGACEGTSGCQAGAEQTEACGNCGTHTRSCSAACGWEAWGPCQGQGACAAGDEETEACGNCGTRTRSCSAACGWEAWGPCQGQGACAAGDEETEACGNCGTHTRSCSTACGWRAWGACGSEGECSAGDEERRSCSTCGEEVRTCSATCVWGAWDATACTGACSPGAQSTGGCGICGTEQYYCEEDCSWVLWLPCEDPCGC